MAITYEIFKDKDLICITCSGPADLEEVVDMLDRLQSDPDFSMSYDVLWDAVGRTTPFTAEHVRLIAAHVGRYKGNGRPKRAFLVSKDVDFGMLRVYESFRYGQSKVDIEIFKDREEAMKWLGSNR